VWIVADWDLSRGGTYCVVKQVYARAVVRVAQCGWLVVAGQDRSRGGADGEPLCGVASARPECAARSLQSGVTLGGGRVELGGLVL
jgi:hypothetical protein